MKTKKPRPRRRVARPLLVAVGALSLGAMVGCDDTVGNPFYIFDLAVPDSAPKDAGAKD